MNICQLTRNPTTGRIEADGYAFHSHDNICVMIPDCNITMRLWEDPRLYFDLERKRWYLEDYPIFRVEGMFAQL